MVARIALKLLSKIMAITKRILIGALLPLSIALMATTCENPCEQNPFFFTVEYKITPGTDSVNIGDTLWIESVTPTKMIDLASKNEILFDQSSNFAILYRVSELIFHNLGDAVDNFDYVVVNGTSEPNDNSALDNMLKSFQYIEENDFYKLKFGMICKQKGLYAIFNMPVGGILSPRHGSCKKAAIQLKINNNDKHIQYLQDTYYSGYVIPDAVIESSYCFRVF
jgi:hypothetical protein